jgi:hypothetical protein
LHIPQPNSFISRTSGDVITVGVEFDDLKCFMRRFVKVKKKETLILKEDQGEKISEKKERKKMERNIDKLK